jgi:diketogulonate reductase-like aldo/keto reductase
MDLHSRAVTNNGVSIPWVGLGMYQVSPGSSAEKIIQAALACGYRHFDTAKLYGNEASLGKAVRSSAIPRAELFITTKLWNSDHGYDRTLRACDESLSKLGLEYVDLYLVHWPVEGTRRETWRAIEALLEQGKARAIGVSNYMPRHLQELFGYARVVPAANQIELSPYNFSNRREVIDLCRSHGILLQAYSPLTKGYRLKDQALVQIAHGYGKTTAQVLIRYMLQKEVVVLPKSSQPERIRQNIAVFDFEISAGDMARLDGFSQNLVTSWDPSSAP